MWNTVLEIILETEDSTESTKATVILYTARKIGALIAF